MGRPRRGTEYVQVTKYCESCGTRLNRRANERPGWFAGRRFCSIRCVGIALRGPKPERWDPSLTNWNVMHGRARALKPSGPCESCGADKATAIHHKDKDFTNNDLANLERLCSGCHGRRHTSPKKKCSVSWCERPMRRNQLCEAHSLRARHGMDLDIPFQPRRRRRRPDGEQSADVSQAA